MLDLHLDSGLMLDLHLDSKCEALEKKSSVRFGYSEPYHEYFMSIVSLGS